MFVSIDLCIVPIGVGISLSPYIAKCQEVLERTGLDYELGPNGTAIEGEWEEVFECVRACHCAVHELGALRIYTSVKINTRTDKKQSFSEKVQSPQKSTIITILQFAIIYRNNLNQDVSLQILHF